MALIQGLAQRARPGAILGQLDSARVDLKGRAVSLWFYNYFYQLGGARYLDGWLVNADGRLEYVAGEPLTIPLEVGDLTGFLGVDTDVGVATSLSQGAQACVDAAPNAGWFNTAQYSYRFGEPTLRITLFNAMGAGASEVYLNPVNGSIKARWVSCPV